MTYKVSVQRICYAEIEIKVEAANPKEAREKALDEAKDADFRSVASHSEYKAVYINPK